MNERALIEQMYREMNGNKEHDRAVLEEWADKYRMSSEAKLVLKEIGVALFRLDKEDIRVLTEEFLIKAREKLKLILADAKTMIATGKYEAALEILRPAVERVDEIPLPEDSVWMDFDRFLDILVFQDYFADEIGDREIRRHPAQPAELLYTYGSLLIAMGHAEEALEPLTQLISLDPVSPRYLFELGEAYKRSGDYQSAYETALLALACAANKEELARCYRDMAFCLSESEAYLDALSLYKLSFRYQASQQAEDEMAWISRKTGLSPSACGEKEISACCARRGISAAMSQTVRENIALLEQLMPSRAAEKEE